MFCIYNQLCFNPLKTAFKIQLFMLSPDVSIRMETVIWHELWTSALYIWWAASATAVLMLDRSCTDALWGLMWATTIVTVDPWTQYLFQCTNVNVFYIFYCHYFTSLKKKKDSHHTRQSPAVLICIHRHQNCDVKTFLYIRSTHWFTFPCVYIFTLPIVTRLLIWLK